MRAFVVRVALVFAGLAVAGVLGHVAWRGTLDTYAGAWSHAPEDAPWVLSAPARDLVAAAFADADERSVFDARVAAPDPAASAGATAYGGAPLTWLAAQVRAHAAGVRHADKAGAEYVSRLLRQVRAMPGDYRLYLFARGGVYDSKGRRDPERSRDHVANDYVVSLAQRAPDTLMPVVSVHPYRPDAVAEIGRWARAGVRRLSWLPVAQDIDLTDPRVQDCYAVMVKHGMTLQLPVGYRQADNGAEGWIDPQALRPALAAGVDVVVTLAGAEAPDGRRLMSRLFALLRDPAYRKHLSIDLAGVLASDRLEDVLEPLLQHPQFYSRLRYASGYPQPAVAADIDLDALVARGFLAADEVVPLREIYDVNPLLFALVTLRQVHLPATDLGLPSDVFFRKPP